MFETGATPGAGTFTCDSCGAALTLEGSERLPECPHCDRSTFRRASMFETLPDHSTTTEFPIPADDREPEWLASVRQSLEPGCYLAFEDDGADPSVIPLAEGWTRIGRSVAADVRLDDPSVSRRHALIVWEKSSLRVLDDRSLNGVFRNGELVEWSRLADGDELSVGRYRLFVLAV